MEGPDSLIPALAVGFVAGALVCAASVFLWIRARNRGRDSDRPDKTPATLHPDTAHHGAAGDDRPAAGGAGDGAFATFSRNERFLRRVQGLAQIGYWEWDARTGITLWSDHTYHLVGAKPATVSPSLENWLDYVHPDDRDRVGGLARKAVEQGTPLDFEYRLCRADGSERIMHVVADVSGQAVDESGNISHSLEGVVQDVTERRRAEEREATQTRLLHTIFDHMRQGIALFDQDQNLVAFNDRFAEFARLPEGFLHPGLSRRELLEEPARQGAIKAETIDCRLSAMARSEHFWERFIDPDGGVTLFERSPLPSGGVILSVSDVTELHRAEARLAQARTMEGVGRFAVGVTHEFNNLISALQGTLDAMASEARGPAGSSDLSGSSDTVGQAGEESPLLQRAMRIARRGAHLSMALQAVAGRKTLDGSIFDVTTAISETVAFMESVLHPRIAIRIVSDARRLPVRTERASLDSALIGLILNARDALPEGGEIQVHSRLETLMEDRIGFGERFRPGAYVVIEVVDNGVGMPAEVVARAFEPFFTTKGGGHGEGLGLSHVHGLARNSGGHAALESTPGHGTTARLWLPLAESGDGASLTPRLEPGAPVGMDSPVGTTASGQGAVVKGEEGSSTERFPVLLRREILLVEDDADVRETALAILRSAGYGVTAVASAEEALGMMRGGFRPQALVSDVILKGALNGDGLAEAARTLSPNLPVLFISGYLGEDAPKILRSRMTGFLTKPFTREALLREVSTLLEAQR